MHREQQLDLMRTQVSGEIQERELRLHKERHAAADAARTRQETISIGGHMVARELRRNAAVAKRCEDGNHVPSETQHITTADWARHREAIARLGDDEGELLEDLERTYSDLEDAKLRGGWPPHSDHLIALSRRLEVWTAS